MGLRHKLNYYSVSARRCDSCRIYTHDRLGKKFICNGICKPGLREFYKKSLWKLERDICIFCEGKSDVMIGKIAVCRECREELKI
jgi:hypothetical protein